MKIIPLKRSLRRLKLLSRDLIEEWHLQFFPTHWYKKKVQTYSSQPPFSGIPKKPLLTLETTDICNINCVMCDTASATRTKGFMSMEDFVSNLDRLEAAGQRIVAFHTIGDPLVDKQVGLKLQLCYERDIQVMLRTNGLLLHKFLEPLVKYPPAYLLFSIDGATKETYEKIRVGGKFDRLVKNIDEIFRLYKKKHILSAFGVNFAVMDENMDEIPLFYQKFHPYFKLHNMHFELLNSLSGDRGKFFGSNNTLSQLSKWVPPCNMPFNSIYILHDQKIAVCCRDYHGELVVGNLKEESLDQIWNGEKINELRKAHINARNRPDALPKACRECYVPAEEFTRKFDLYVHFLLQRNIRKYGSHHLPISEISDHILNFLAAASKNRVNRLPDPQMIL